jgi:hypothetical protein
LGAGISVGQSIGLGWIGSIYKLAEDTIDGTINPPGVPTARFTILSPLCYRRDVPLGHGVTTCNSIYLSIFKELEYAIFMY